MNSGYPNRVPLFIRGNGHGLRQPILAIAVVAIDARHPPAGVALIREHYRRHAAWLVLPVLLASFLVWREERLRSHWRTEEPAVATLPDVEVGRSLAVTTLALAFGFQAADARASERSDITLKATFVSSAGGSRALVALDGKVAAYRIGDRLAGGAVVRRIESHAVALWIDGVEEVLPLEGTKGSLLHLVRETSHAPTKPDSHRLFLRTSR